jgi:two-component system cell cycle sensor histidine kinase/response regulator CckA
MNSPDFSRMKDAAAIQFMVMDLLGNILGLSESPAKMAFFLVQQIRELVGARIVVLVQYLGPAAAREYRLVAVEPSRYQKTEKLQNLSGLVACCQGIEEPTLLEPDGSSLEVTQVLERMGSSTAVIIPLMIGNDRSGDLFALDLLDMSRSSDVVRSLGMLAPVVGIVLRNALFYETLEVEVQARTRELSQSERHFRTLTNVAPVGIFHLYKEQRLVFVNEQWRRITGIDWVEGAAENFMRVIHPADQAWAWQAWREAHAAHRNFHAEFRIQHADGRILWIMAAATEERDEAGELVGIIGTLTDLSDRHRAEQERLQLEAQLYQSQRIESIGRLAGGVAHDINNMLSAIMAHTELLKLKLPPGDPLLVHTREMERAAHRSRDIIRQLLAFSRKQVIEPVVLDLNQRIEETKRTIVPLIGEHLDLAFLPWPTSLSILIDPSQLDQILVNLVVNARDAMPKGGRISIETRPVHLDRVFLSKHPDCRAGDYVLLALSDEGTGMSPEVQARIFEPFFTTKAEGKGTGLGLSTVFGIVNQNGGFIEVDTEFGRGTTFRIYLPSTGKAVGLEEAALEPGFSIAGGNILLVEDDEIIREVLPHLLKELGYQTRIATSPGEALQICRDPANPIDLLLTDVVMPGMSGKELSDKVVLLRPGIRVLFMSGYTAEVIAQQGVLEEGVQFLQKPFTLPDLGHKLEAVMRSPGPSH